MAQFKEAMPGWGKVLAHALPVAGGVGLGAALPSLMDKKKPEPKFNEEEKREFARHGIDPKALNFYQTLGNLMRGMRMQQNFMQTATRGGTMAPPPEEPENTGLDQYA